MTKRVLKLFFLWMVLVFFVVVAGRIMAGKIPQRPVPDPPDNDGTVRERAAALHHDALLLDGHNDVPS